MVAGPCCQECEYSLNDFYKTCEILFSRRPACPCRTTPRLASHGALRYSQPPHAPIRTRPSALNPLPTLLLAAFLTLPAPAFALSDAPLRVISSYIDSNANCSEQIADWNRKNGKRAIAGEISREFYYRVLGFLDWGACGRPYFKPIFIELQKAWTIYSNRRVTEAEYTAKEAELINLLFSALQAGDAGEAMVRRYEQTIAAKLIRLEPERQFFNCTYFGDQPKCTD